MKITLLTLGTVILFAIGSIATTSFAGAGHDKAEAKGGHHGNEGGGHAGGHSGRMNDIMKKLKHELGDKYNHPVPAATNEQLVSGKKIFSNLCVACHGVSGKGNGPAAAALKQKPADFTDAEHSRIYSDQGRMQIIRKGIAGTPMSGWEGTLNAKEIQSVHAYIRSLRSPVKNGEHGHGDGAH